LQAFKDRLGCEGEERKDLGKRKRPGKFAKPTQLAKYGSVMEEREESEEECLHRLNVSVFTARPEFPGRIVLLPQELIAIFGPSRCDTTNVLFSHYSLVDGEYVLEAVIPPARFTSYDPDNPHGTDRYPPSIPS